MADMTDTATLAAQQTAIHDLTEAAERVARALAAMDVARAAQREAIAAAAKAGLPETQIALHGNVNRMTVRAALGK